MLASNVPLIANVLAEGRVIAINVYYLRLSIRARHVKTNVLLVNVLNAQLIANVLMVKNAQVTNVR